MNEARESDCTDPLMIKIREDCDETDNDVKKSFSGGCARGKWHNQNVGLVRNKRSGTEQTTNLANLALALNTVTNNRKRLIILAVLVILLIYANTTTISSNDDRPIDRIQVNHKSHVPGMKDNASNAMLNRVDSDSTQHHPLIGNHNTNQQVSTDPTTSISKRSPTNTTYNKSTQNSDETSDLNDGSIKPNTTPSLDFNVIDNLTFAEIQSTTEPEVVTSPNIFNEEKNSDLPSEQPITENAEQLLELSGAMINNENSTVLSTIKINSTQRVPITIIENQSLPLTTLSATTATTPKPLTKIGFLVWTRECQIPDLDPFAPKIRLKFKKFNHPKCLKNPLTEIIREPSNNKTILHLFYSRVEQYKYNKAKFTCCYSEILRTGSGGSADDKVKTSKCVNFNDTIELSPKLGPIMVTCKNDTKKVYENIHILIPQNEKIDKRLSDWRTKASNLTKPLNVILFGIDSVSRMNLIRTMPLTRKHVEATGWYEMAGYNKVDDNTFPNLMAALTGYNSSTAYKKCKPKQLRGLDDCSFIWKDYSNAGYVTAYAEDTQIMSTFNYLKKGFTDPPTDYYLRPAMLMAENHLKISKLKGLKFCLGYQSAPEYVYNYAFQVKDAYKNEPNFGLFWTNSFSHNSFDTPTTMDEQVVNYLKRFNSTGIMNDTVIIFFSDHGMRFGSLRWSPTGHLEERLPFLYLWLPLSFQIEHPSFVNALKINKHRLTTPYDLHMTLKHILELSDRVQNLGPAPDCLKAQSLFYEIPENRSCEDVNIEDHWCTCRAFHNVDKSSAKVKRVVARTLDYINNLVKETNNGSIAHLCQTLRLKDIVYANQEVLPHEPANTTLEGYQLLFNANPGNARYETTVRLDTVNDEFTVTGTISRLDTYSKTAKCIKVESAKKYCVCKR